MSSDLEKQTTPANRLLSSLADFGQVAVVMHDNPDPDAIATGWALARLVQQRLHKPVRLLGGGAIVRAENKYMVELLAPPIQLVTDLCLTDDTATVLVDCGVGTSNHLVTRSGMQPVAVIDHHANGGGDANLTFSDIRPGAVASASIAASYLRDCRVDPGMKLATAILYAIRTESRGGDTQYSPLDRSIVKWLTDIADMTLLADIENAPLDREYFADLVLAMQQTYVYGDAALCFLPRASGAEIVGEVADLLIRCRGIRRVLCAAGVGDDLILSARTERDSGNAAKLLQSTLDGLGGCGGHEHRSGGKIPHVRRGGKLVENLHGELRSRWLGACGASDRQGARLVARREIIEHL